jgi:hypothetical protein
MLPDDDDGIHAATNLGSSQLLLHQQVALGLGIFLPSNTFSIKLCLLLRTLCLLCLFARDLVRLRPPYHHYTKYNCFKCSNFLGLPEFFAVRRGSCSLALNDNKNDTM